MAIAKSATADLVQTTGVVLYQAPTGYTMTGNLRITNRNAFNVRVRVAISKGSIPENAEYIDYDISIPPNGVMEDTALIIVPGEFIWVWSDNSNVSVRLHGIEEIL